MRVAGTSVPRPWKTPCSLLLLGSQPEHCCRPSGLPFAPPWRVPRAPDSVDDPAASACCDNGLGPCHLSEKHLRLPGQGPAGARDQAPPASPPRSPLEADGRAPGKGRRLMQRDTSPGPLRRAWTVEVRPMGAEVVMTCEECGRLSSRPGTESVRGAVVAHLVLHVRAAPLAAHLRTCQCGQYGCRWHPRHRGCDGLVRLVLARCAGGRLWRLADTCQACATATPQAANVPEPQGAPVMSPAAARGAEPVRCVSPLVVDCTGGPAADVWGCDDGTTAPWG